MAFETTSMNPNWIEPAGKFVDSHFPEAVATLGKLVKIPGIAWESFDPQNLVDSANAVADELSSLELFDFVEIRQAKKPGGELGAPAVVARRQGKAFAPHVLLYAHHDVQPPGDLASWDSDPFQATLVGERLYGRGASDDKSGIITHLYSLKALKSLVQELNIGITVFVEGEEEAGSESFPEFLRQNNADLQADLIIVADSGNWSEDVPALTTSLRAMVSQTFTIRTLKNAVHSGMYGGPLPDATGAMIKLLATLTDENGDVAIRGLKSTLVQGPDLPDDQFSAIAGLLPGVKRLGTKSPTQQIWGEPAVTIIGVDVPSVDMSSNTALPECRARVSLRLAPDQDPGEGLEALKAHLIRNAPKGAEIKFGRSEAGPGYLAKDGWAAKLAHQAFTASWPNPSINMGIGGSIPFISVFAETFPDAQILVTGVEEPDSRAHSPNESQHLPTLKRAILAQTLILLNGNEMSAQELN